MIEEEKITFTIEKLHKGIKKVSYTKLVKNELETINQFSCKGTQVHHGGCYMQVENFDCGLEFRDQACKKMFVCIPKEEILANLVMTMEGVCRKQCKSDEDCADIENKCENSLCKLKEF